MHRYGTSIRSVWLQKRVLKGGRFILAELSSAQEVKGKPLSKSQHFAPLSWDIAHHIEFELPEKKECRLQRWGETGKNRIIPSILTFLGFYSSSPSFFLFSLLNLQFVISPSYILLHKICHFCQNRLITKACVVYWKLEKVTRRNDFF